MKSFVKWTIVILSVAAAGMSLWLTIQKLTGQVTSLTGCGAESGCSNVLGSKWSVVFAIIPVSLFSFGLYVAVLASLWMSGEKVRWFRMLAAWMFIGAAAWFTYLQLGILKTICPYCMVMHALGVLLGCVILLIEYKEGGRGRAVNSFPAAMVLVMGFSAIQYYGPEPETHRIDIAVTDNFSSESNPHMAGGGRVVSFLDNKKSYRVAELPHLGAVNAEHVIVEYFDYTCEACRDVHRDLDSLMEKHPLKLAVIVLPVPLHKKCNPHLPVWLSDHVEACELARLSLRVWRADPEKFKEFHGWLFQQHALSIQVAEAKAYSLVGEKKMSDGDVKWIDGIIVQNMKDYKFFIKTTPVMPKLLLKDSVIMQGKAKDKATLEELLHKQLGL